MKINLAPVGSTRSPGGVATSGGSVGARFLGIDAGAETIKLIEVQRNEDGLRVSRREIVEHGQQPGPALVAALRRWEWDAADGAAVSGRFAGQIKLPRVPTKQALLRGYLFSFGDEPGREPAPHRSYARRWATARLRARQPLSRVSSPRGPWA